jgi:hypothetical protein
MKNRSKKQRLGVLRVETEEEYQRRLAQARAYLDATREDFKARAGRVEQRFEASGFVECGALAGPIRLAS